MNLHIPSVRSHESIAIAADEALADPVIVGFDHKKFLGILYIHFPTESPPHRAQRHAPHLCLKETRILKRLNVLYVLSRNCDVAKRKVVQFEGDR